MPYKRSLLNDFTRRTLGIRLMRSQQDDRSWWFSGLRISSTSNAVARYMYESELWKIWREKENIVLHLRELQKPGERTDEKLKYLPRARIDIPETAIPIVAAKEENPREYQDKVLYHPPKSNDAGIDFLIRDGNKYYGLQTTIGSPYIGPALKSTISKFGPSAEYSHIIVRCKNEKFVVKPSNWPEQTQFPFPVYQAVVPFQDD